MFIELTKLFSSLIIIQNIGIFVLADIPRPRGVSVEQASLYASTDYFVCLDGKKKLNRSKLNDDFCDCDDGSDEPGTSACPNAKFYCLNAGYHPTRIPSSHVNDGICDCCDGFDEYNSSTQCVNNCNELGREEKELQKKLEELAKQGNVVRSDMITKGKTLKEENSARLATLQQSIDQAAALKSERETIKKTAEDLESAALEVYKQAEEEEKRKKQELEAVENRREAETTFKQFDSNGDGVVELADLQTRVQFDSNRDGQVTEDEAKYFLDQHDQVDLETFVTVCWPRIKPYLMLDAGLFKPPQSVEEAKAEEVERIDEEQQVDAEVLDSDEGAELAHEEDVGEEEAYDEEETGEGHVDQVETTVTEPQYDDETQRLINEANEGKFMANVEVIK